MEQHQPPRDREFTAATLAALAIIASLSSGAAAADFPNLIGTWAIANKGRPPPYQIADNASMTVKIVKQDGESFSGTIVGLKGKTERLTGAFRRDRATFVYSSDKTAGIGQIDGNQMKICRTDAGCAILTRSK
jgi:hypothetical protein